MTIQEAQSLAQMLSAPYWIPDDSCCTCESCLRGLATRLQDTFPDFTWTDNGERLFVSSVEPSTTERKSSDE